MIAILILGLVLGANAFQPGMSQSDLSNKKQVSYGINQISGVGHDEIVFKPVSFLIHGQEVQVRTAFKFDSDADDAKLKFRLYSSQKDGKEYDVTFKGMLHFRVEGQDHSNFTYSASMTNANPVSEWTTTLTRKTIMDEVAKADRICMLIELEYSKIAYTFEENKMILIQ